MAQRNAAQFEALVAEHRGGVARVCRAILRDEDLAADAAQETFVRLWRQVVDEREPDPCGPWLRRVALSAALDLARRREARSRAEERVRVAPEASAPESHSPPRLAALDELERELDLALRELPEGQRPVFALRHRGGANLSEIAELLDLALPTVKTHFARACLRLQARLARFDPESKR
jgi:RNA polymerase sigma-70 factor (ECF subfamily)